MITAAQYQAEANTIASANGFSFDTLPQNQQAAQLLKQVWQVIPDNELVGILASSEYTDRSTGKQKHTEIPYWQYPDDIQDDSETSLYEWASSHNSEPGELGSIYYNVASRQARAANSRYNARGAYHELGSVGALWCDIDSAKDGQPLQAGIDALLSFTLPPSLIVFSGGGLQALWLLDQRWDISNEVKARDFSEWQRGYFFNQFEQNKLSFDKSVFDATRELRLVGFINKKSSRGGSIARLLYSNLTRYTAEQIKEHATPPKQGVKRAYYPAIEKLPGASVIDHPDHVYHLTPEICRYFFNGEIPLDGERHNTARSISYQAAISGVPLDLWTTHLINLAEHWYPDGEIPSDYDDNISQAATWAYDRVNESAEFNTGHTSDLFGWVQENTICAVKITTNQFERVRAADLTRQDERILSTGITLPTRNITLNPVRSPVTSTELTDSVTLDADLTLQQIRQQIPQTIQSYQKAKNPNAILLLQAPPGSGKTFATLGALDILAKDNLQIDSGDNHHGRGLLLTLFKADQLQGASMFKHFNADPTLAMYFEARNDNPASPGYCVSTEKANLLGSRNENVESTLCMYCPILSKCKVSGYLSQFDRTKTIETLVARHQHGFMPNMNQGRHLVVIDESPLDKVSAPFKVRAEDFKLPKQFPDVAVLYKGEIALINQVLTALKSVVLSNPSLAGTPYPTIDHVKLGGRYLFNMLFKFMPESEFKRFTELEKETILEITRHKIDLSTESSIILSPPNFIQDLQEILCYEYTGYYSKGSENWNSRLIIYGHSLHIHAMHPYQIMKKSRVIITDATGMPDLYPIAFTDKQGRPKHLEIYAPVLEHKAEIIQLTGTDNCKSTVVRAIRKAKEQNTKNNAQNASILNDMQLTGTTLADILIPEAAFQGITLKEIESNSESLEVLAKSEDIQNWQEVISYLAKKHCGSLLVVTYRELAQYMRVWATRNNVLCEKNIQWFGNLKGRNDYENLEAVIILGTPRINQMDLFSLAQVWNWQDPSPLIFDQELKQVSFPGTGLARQYRGYIDHRINNLYLHMIQSEMRQCYERIRPQSSGDTKKIVYIASGMPCSDYVSKIIDYRSFVMFDIVKPLFEQMLTNSGKVLRTQFVAECKRIHNCSESAAIQYYDMCIENRDDLEVLTVAKKKIVVKRGVDHEIKTKFQTAIEWLNSDPNRDKWRVSAIDVVRENPDISIPTATKAVKEWRKELYNS